MVITRTPFRVSFFGGGTDYPVYYRKFGGAVLSTTIDKYCYIIVRNLSRVFPYRFGIRYTEMEEVDDLSQIRHPSARECLRYLGFENEPVVIQHGADLPAMAGLGASSSFTVGLLNALYAYRGVPVEKKKLALEAIHVEQERIKENVGSQDQTAAVFGGINKINFTTEGKIEVYPVSVGAEVLHELQNHLLMVYTGKARIASDVAASQIKNTPKKEAELHKMKEMVDEAVLLLGNKGRLEDFGRLLHESWMLKRTLSPHVTSDLIDNLYQEARRRGALGGKLLGAGGGGFLLIFAKPETHVRIREALSPLHFIPFHFENTGSTVIYRHQL